MAEEKKDGNRILMLCGDYGEDYEVLDTIPCMRSILISSQYNAYKKCINTNLYTDNGPISNISSRYE